MRTLTDAQVKLLRDKIQEWADWDGPMSMSRWRDLYHADIPSIERDAPELLAILEEQDVGAVPPTAAPDVPVDNKTALTPPPATPETRSVMDILLDVSRNPDGCGL